MLRFYLNGKLFGCYIIVTFILMSVSNFVNVAGRIRGNISESGEIIYPNTRKCLKEGYFNGIHVYRIGLHSKIGQWLHVFQFGSEVINSDYKDLIEKVTLDCNGRNVCNSSYSGVSVLKPMIAGIPVQYIEITFSCYSISVDNITVFNIGLDLDLNILKDGPLYFLVLRLQNTKKTHRHCKIRGNPSRIWIKPLHVDFGPISECNQINSDSLHQCYENMTLVSRHDKECNFTWQPPFKHKYFDCYSADTDIDIHMSTGFVWIGLNVESDFKLHCRGSNNNKDDIRYIGATGTTHSKTTKLSFVNENGSSTKKTTVETEIFGDR